MCFHFCSSAFPWASSHLLSQNHLRLRSADNMGKICKGWTLWLGCGHWQWEALVSPPQAGSKNQEPHPWRVISKTTSLDFSTQSAPTLTAPSLNTQQTLDVASLSRQSPRFRSSPCTEPTSRSPQGHHSTPGLLVNSKGQAAAPRPAGTKTCGGGFLPAPPFWGDVRLTPGN